MSFLISSQMKLLLPQQVPAGCPKDVRPYFEEVYNAIQQLQYYMEQYGGITQKEVTLWPQLKPTDTLLEHQAQRLYVITGEAIAYGALVNLYNNAGVLTVRNANATNNTKPAHGICINTEGASGANAYIEVMLLRGLTTGIAGLTVGARYFLSTVNGLITTVEPVAAGNIGQVVGVALATDIFYSDINLQWVQH